TTPGRLDDGRLSSSAIEDENTLAGGEYGYGLVIAELDGHPWLGHAGGIDGFSSSLAEFPRDRTTVAVLANSVGPGKGAFQVAARIQRIAIGAEAEPDRDRQPKPVTPSAGRLGAGPDQAPEKSTPENTSDGDRIVA